MHVMCTNFDQWLGEDPLFGIGDFNIMKNLKSWINVHYKASVAGHPTS